MKKRFFKTMIFLLISLLVFTGCSATSNAEEEHSTAPSEVEPVEATSVNSEMDSESQDFEELIPATVYVEGNTIVYEGDIHAESIRQLIELHTDDIERIVLKSLGGEINDGLDLAEFIHENQLDVEIKDYAFSSAANYVALAAKTLYLSENSLLGFHGGATQDIDLFGELGEEERQAIEEYLSVTTDREAAFYEMIGVNQAITTIGQDAKFDEIAEGHIGYTYTLEALNALGVDNIELLDGSWNTPTAFIDDPEATLFVIDKDDIE